MGRHVTAKTKLPFLPLSLDCLPKLFSESLISLLSHHPIEKKKIILQEITKITVSHRQVLVGFCMHYHVTS